MPQSATEHDRYILHLNHALAMESALVDHLEKRAHAVTQPKVRERILQHRDETVQHRETVRGVIESLNGEPTRTKATVQPAIAPGVVGKVLSALEAEKEDRMLAEDLADFAVENYEAGLYNGLSLIARNLGFTPHIAKFEAIRQQEVAMADFLESNLPAAIQVAFPPQSKVA